jgi:diguanylate cyclase (GGDEF)-like protein
MQSFTLLKTGSAPDRRQEAWSPMAPVSGPVVNDLDSARAALTEAERVIRSQEEHIRQLENMALTDDLTGLLNRRGFTNSLQRELAMARRDMGASGVLVMVDVDDFKSINDQWGHKIGDDYLCAVAEALSACVRTSDVVARLGGDEFALLFTRMNEDVGIKRLARLEKSFHGRVMPADGKTLPLCASFGLASYKGADTPETVLAAADLKLYAHKARRRAPEES